MQMDLECPFQPRFEYFWQLQVCIRHLSSYTISGDKMLKLRSKTVIVQLCIYIYPIASFNDHDDDDDTDDADDAADDNDVAWDFYRIHTHYTHTQTHRNTFTIWKFPG